MCCFDVSTNQTCCAPHSPKNVIFRVDFLPCVLSCPVVEKLEDYEYETVKSRRNYVRNACVSYSAIVLMHIFDLATFEYANII